jgi:hypothetical protein
MDFVAVAIREVALGTVVVIDLPIGLRPRILIALNPFLSEEFVETAVVFRTLLDFREAVVKEDRALAPNW